MAFEKFRKTYLPANPDVWSLSEIVVDEDNCTGCGNCVEACPMACLELFQKKARMVVMAMVMMVAPLAMMANQAGEIVRIVTDMLN